MGGRHALFVAGLGLLASGCASGSALRAGDQLLRGGRYGEAERWYAAALARSPGDPELLSRRRQAQRLALLARGREAFFEGRREESVAYFEAAAAEDPEDAAARAWTLKARRALADAAIARGRGARADEDFDGARVAYEEALEWMPGNAEAKAELARLAEEIERRISRADGYYVTGMRSFGEDRLEESRADFRNSLKYNPDHVRAPIRRGEVARRIAEDRLERARALLGQRRYHAARLEVEIARAVSADLPGVERLREEVEREVAADEKVRRADFAATRGDLNRAAKLFEEAASLTVLEREGIETKRRELAERRLEGLYRTALDLEADRRYTRALEVYADLLERARYYRDAIARSDNIRALLGHLSSLYEKATEAEKAGDATGALRRYEEIGALYPDFRDVAERRARLLGTSTRSSPTDS